MRAFEHVGGHEVEEAGGAQVDVQHHHAEEQENGVPVHGPVRLVERQRAEGDEERRADERDRGAVHLEPRVAANRHADEGDGDEGGDEPVECGHGRSGLGQPKDEPGTTDPIAETRKSGRHGTNPEFSALPPFRVSAI